MIALTDNPASPLACTAHQVFYVDAVSASVLRSMTAFTSPVQALVARVAQVSDQHVRASLQQEERMLREFGAYLTDRRD